jgi:hypothetical protein
MNSMRSNRGTGKTASVEDKHYFDIMPILLNIIAAVVLGGIYYYTVKNNLFPAYQNYIYWTVNIIISYNILAASARSLWAPLISVIIGGAGIFFANSSTVIPFISSLTPAQCWQFAALGVAGLLITFALRL